MEKFTILKQLCDLDAVAGHEDEVRKFMKDHMEKMKYEIIQDKLGGIFAYKPSKKSNAPTIMIAAHMDEVGFIVTGHTKHGLLKIHPLGGFWSQVLLTMRVSVTNCNGKKYSGTISSIAPHLLTPESASKPFDIKNMQVDCGFYDEDDAKKHIEIGSIVTPEANFKQLNENRYISKAFDDRFGCALALDLLHTLKDVELDVNLYIGANVQEEVGLRGAAVSAQMINPDVFIAVDSSPARDTDGDISEFGRLGEGFLIRHIDRGFIHNRAFKDYMCDLADKKNIKYQDYHSPGGTDAAMVHTRNEGILSTVVGIAARNIHTHSSIIDIRDYDSAKAIVLEIVNNIDYNIIKEVRDA